MLIAFNSQGQLIHASQAKAKAKYYCSETFVPMEMRLSSKNQPYFAKINHQGASESQEHLLGKQQIYTWCQQQGWLTDLEVPVNSIQQRIDVLANVKQQKVAFEFQCSPISIQTLKKRTTYYWRAGYNVYWFLGSPYRPISRKMQAKFTQWDQHQPVLYWWHVKQGKFSKQVMNLNNFNNNDLINRELNRLKWQRRHKTHSALLNLAYLNHHQLWLCPAFLHNWGESWPLTSDHLLEWQLKVLLQLERLPLKSQWTPEQWFQWVEQQTNWLPMPCLRVKQQQILHQRLINRLTQRWSLAEVLKVTKQGIIFWQLPKWYGSEQEKKRHLSSWRWDQF
ncbi:hypothetical protein LG045_06720 [Limosilactobacillus gastricus]|uniref:Competence protein n=1 Tax=Limosilactobacillus gastricus DSM 16045 TaxID=1423749 RepID=A0A0R1VBI6_9LACO|nr:competence protein CoiA family protein [Limosilactobacillus gastricus]KRM02874.1 Competence protein [Limosilactobacillus gastricus DSM 16045]QGF40798.1 hypothetical protein LG045_06720 [Limosilactobacillus gastricus]